MKVDATENIGVTRAQVFDLMADQRNEPIWNTQVTKTDLESPEPIGPGSWFTTVYRGQTYTNTITGYQRPSRLTFTVTGKPMTIIARMSFEESGSSTRLRAEFDLQPRGVMKALLPLVRPVVRRDFPRQLAGFKRFCESSDYHRAEP